MLTSKGIIKNVIFSVRRRYSIQHQKVIMGVWPLLSVGEDAEIPDSISAWSVGAATRGYVLVGERRSRSAAISAVFR
jgi:hypothetical protein